MKPLLAYESAPLRAHRYYVHATGFLQSAVLLFMRLSMGYIILLSGYRHLQIVPQMVKNFEGWGVPFPELNVYISSFTEVIGGSLLILGLGARLIALPLVFNFIVAVIAASRGDIAKAFQENGLLNFKDSGAWETIANDTAFQYLVLALVMLAFGPGKASVDYLLSRKYFCESGHAPAAVAPAPTTQHTL